MSKDIISRQSAIDATQGIGRLATLPDGDAVIRMSAVEYVLFNLPSAQPERRKGKWINGVCDQCGSHAPYWAMATTYYSSGFCPNCGADMRGDSK